MTSQSSSGNKRSQWFRWKHENNDKYIRTLGVGRTAREVITDFINKHLNKNIGDFQQEFESIKYGKYLRVVSLKEGEKVNKDNGYKLYFTKLEHHVPLKNGEIVVISNRWGATRSYEKPWKEFKDKMAELDYFITVADESNK